MLALGAATESSLGRGQVGPLGRMTSRTGPSRDLERSLATVRDAGATPAARAEAARDLMRADTPDGRARVLELLGAKADAECRRLVLSAACEATSTDPWLVEALAGLLAAGNDVDDADQARVISALGAVRTRESAQALVRALCAAESAERRDAAHAALVRCTGQMTTGADCAAWTAWLSRSMLSAELEWMREQAIAQADRADVLARQLAATTARIVDVLRRSYIDATSADERSRLLTAWLGDELAEVRRLAVELINRELANARQIDPKVAARTLALLRDPMPDLRAKGADAAVSLGPDGAADGVARALLTETDPIVAASLLRGAARWPSGMTAEVVLEWAEVDPQEGTRGAPTALRAARRAALDAAAALAGADLLSPAGASRVLAVLRRMADADLGAGGCGLLTRLGADEDRARVVAMLRNPALKGAAADGLAADARGVPALLGAAGQDAGLFSLAARAVARWSPSAAAFGQVAALPAPTPEGRREALLQVAAALDSDDLLTAARASGDAALREALLSRLATGPSSRRSWASTATGADPAVAAGLLLLAETRLDLGQPSGAIAALEALSASPNSVDPVVRASMMTVALLWLNRIDEAGSAGAGADAWIEGLRRASALPHAREILTAIRARFAASLTPEQMAKLGEIEGTLSSAAR